MGCRFSSSSQFQLSQHPTSEEADEEKEEIVCESANDGTFDLWNELPRDLLVEISKRLSPVDRICISRACRDWRTIARPIPESSGILWRVYLRHDDGLCRLINPSRDDQIYYVEYPELAGARILSTGHGWLLMHKSSASNIFFFNLMTREKKNLPSRFLYDKLLFTSTTSLLYTHAVDALYSGHFAFSSSPTSSDCTVVSVQIGQFDFLFQSWHSGGKVWILHRIKNDPSLEIISLIAPSQAKHLVYCLGLSGKIGVLDLGKNSWMLRDKPVSEEQGKQWYMCECEGEIFFVDCGEDKVLKLNDSMKIAEEILNFNGRAIYLNRFRTAQMARVGEGATGNKIYCPGSWRVLRTEMKKEGRYEYILLSKEGEMLESMGGIEYNHDTWIQV